MADIEVVFDKIDFTAHSDKHERGGVDTIDVGNLPIASDINVEDFDINFGSSQQVSLGYESTNDSLVMRQEDGSKLIEFDKNGNIEVTGDILQIRTAGARDEFFKLIDNNSKDELRFRSFLNDEVFGVQTFDNSAGVVRDKMRIRADRPETIIGAGTNSTVEMREHTSVGDTGKVQLSNDSDAQGYAMVQDVTNGVSTLVYLGGSTNSVEIIHDSGSSNNFTTTEGNNGTTNIYWDSGNARYELENQTGGTVTYSAEVLRA